MPDGRLEHAEATGRAAGLGPVVGLFSRETQGPKQTLIGFVWIALVIAVCVTPSGVSGLPGVPMAVGWGIAAGAVVLLVPVSRLFFRPGRIWWLYLYEGGLAVLDHRGRTTQVLHWAEVARINRRWDPHEDDSGASLTGYRLEAYDGRVVNLLSAYRGELTLAGVLEAAVVRRFAHAAAERVAAGETLVFGPVTVGPAGVTYRKKPPVGWDELAGWRLNDGQLELDRPRGRGRRLVVPMTAVEDGWVLTGLLATRMPESR